MTPAVRKQPERSVLRTTWPAFALILGLIAAVAGLVAFHQSMEDYRGGSSAFVSLDAR